MLSSCWGCSEPLGDSAACITHRLDWDVWIPDIQGQATPRINDHRDNMALERGPVLVGSASSVAFSLLV